MCTARDNCSDCFAIPRVNVNAFPTDPRVVWKNGGPKFAREIASKLDCTQAIEAKKKGKKGARYRVRVQQIVFLSLSSEMQRVPQRGYCSDGARGEIATKRNLPRSNGTIERREKLFLRSTLPCGPSGSSSALRGKQTDGICCQLERRNARDRRCGI